MDGKGATPGEFGRQGRANHQTAVIEGMRAEFVFPKQALRLLQIGSESANPDVARDAATALGLHRDGTEVRSHDQPPALPRRAPALGDFRPGAPLALGCSALYEN